jgi:hypothetical protein
MNKPNPSEYHPFFKTYIELVPNGELLSMLKENLKVTTAFYRAIPKKLSDYRYEINKWSIKELLAHKIDSERVFAYRALVCLRMDGGAKLPEMNENLYVENRNVANVDIKELIEEFEIVRKNTLSLYTNVSEENLSFHANSAAGKITARALGYAIIGHAIHHHNIITERYLNEKE